MWLSNLKFFTRRSGEVSSHASSARFLRALLASSFMAAILLMQACSLPKPNGKPASEDGEDTSATFFMDSAEADVIAESVYEKISFAKSKNFRFTACFKDLNYSKSVSFYNFHVAEISKDFQSDGKGCIQWNEDIEFNALATPNYLYFERTIQGTGLHKGQRKMKLAINPWADGKEIKFAIDISKKVDVPQMISDKVKAKAALLGELEQSRKVWINEGRLSVIQKNFVPGAVRLRIEFNAIPYLELININRVKYKKVLTEADISVEMQLLQVKVETKNGVSHEVRQKLSDSSHETEPFKIRNGEFTASSEVVLPNTSVEGQLVLGLKLKVLNQPGTITPISEFHSIYTIGGYHQLIGRTYLNQMVESLKPNEDGTPFSLESYVNDGQKPTSNDGRQAAKIMVEHLKIQFRKHGDTFGTQRETHFRVTACFINGLDLRSVQAQSFKISHIKIDPKSPSINLVSSSTTDEYITKEKKTLVESCITWDDSFRYENFACSRMIKANITIENENLAVKERIPIAINPWEPKGEYFRDIRQGYGDPDDLNFDCSQRDAHPPRLFIRSTKFSSRDFDPHAERIELGPNWIENDLSLSINKALRFTLEAKIQTFTLEQGRLEPIDPLPGKYLVKIGVLRPQSEIDLGKAPLASWDQRIVDVTDAAITTVFNFKFKDLFAIGNTNEFLVEIYPVDITKIAPAADGTYLPILTNDFNSVISRKSQFISPTYAANASIEKPDETLNAQPISDVRLATFLGSTDKKTELKNNYLIDSLIAKSLEIDYRQAANQKNPNISQMMRSFGLVLASLSNNEFSQLLKRHFLTGQALGFDRGATDYSRDKYQHQLSAAAHSGGETLVSQFVYERGLSSRFASLLCPFFIGTFYPTLAKESPFASGNVDLAIEKCLEAAKESPQDLFLAEEKLLVSHTKGFRRNPLNPVYKEKIGANTQHSVNATMGTSSSEGWNVSGAVRPDTKGISAASAILDSVMQITGFAINGSHSLGITQQVGEGTGNAGAYNTGMDHNVEALSFIIDVDEYRVCKSIRINPKLFSEPGLNMHIAPFLKMIRQQTGDIASIPFIDLIDRNLGTERLTSIILKGFVLCDDKVVRIPLSIKEDYFLINQSMDQNSQMANSRDPLARKYFTTLRGRGDFERLSLVLRQNMMIPRGAGNTDESLKTQFTKYREIFKTGIPTFPNLITRPRN